MRELLRLLRDSAGMTMVFAGYVVMTPECATAVTEGIVDAFDDTLYGARAVEEPANGPTPPTVR